MPSVLLRGIDPEHTFDAAEKLSRQDRPTMLAWAVEDRFFKLSFAERLAASIPGAPSADRGLLHLRLRGPAGASGRVDRLVRARGAPRLARS